MFLLQTGIAVMEAVAVQAIALQQEGQYLIVMVVLMVIVIDTLLVRL